jgi:hypothetical protein
MRFNYDSEKSLADNMNAFDSWKSQGDWVPANNRTEEPFKTRSGYTLLYCFQPRSGKHAYLNVETDMILTDEEALEYLCS